jgi:drug/metabolite transporter (DMT)-like permease
MATAPILPPPRWLANTILAVAVLIFSSSAILVRHAQTEGVASFTIAVWRMGLAAVVLNILFGIQRLRHSASAVAGATPLTMTRREIILGTVAGIFLAAHFASWISSLAYTSVASSTALVTTNPIWIALFSFVVLREKLSKWLIAGVIAALCGSALIFLADYSRAATVASPNPLLGNTLALLGSLTVCGYLLIGRKLGNSSQSAPPLLQYLTVVYSASAVTLLVLCLASGSALTGFSIGAWLALVGLALGPQLLGHSAVNWALRHVSATFVAVVILGEPVASALLAWLFFGEVFSTMQFCGFVVLLSGIYLASRE